MHDLFEGPIGQRPEHSMNMIRHHAPGELAVPLPVEELKRPRHHVGNLRLR